jgi:hypothetical protein
MGVIAASHNDAAERAVKNAQEVSFLPKVSSKGRKQ